MIDAHAHLNDPRLLPHAEDVVARMRRHRVEGALVVGYDVPSSHRAVELARRFPGALRAAVGMHPHDSGALDREALQALRTLAARPEVVACGEIGLDYYYERSPRAVQQDAFRRQLALAAELDLPVVLHERDAADDVCGVMDAEGGWARGGAWHCCGVTPAMGAEVARWLYVGIAGWITFKKAANIRALAQAVPLERLLIETDAPYLAPVPHRGRQNEPAYLPFTAQALAVVKGVPVDCVERITADNALRAFPRWRLPAREG